MDLGFKYSAHYLPHDGSVSDIGTGQKREMMLRKELGSGRVLVMKRTNDVGRDIDISQSKLPKCKFQKKRTSNLADALTNYHAKYNETTQAFSNKPEQTSQVIMRMPSDVLQ